jgi:type VI secretion system secreted protein VgrG
VRVAEALAGPNWGSQFTPRIGTEVLVDFIDNDIDRPLVVAQLYTGADAPPFAAGVDSGVEHAGTISGIHTQTFDGAGWNQWQLDDTQGELRMRLATSTAATQLNLGHLVRQAPGGAQRGNYRGSGFELRTDAWAVVRGAEGVLLTTHARSAQGSGIASTQMDAAEAVASLKAAQSLGATLLDAAAGQHALTSKAAVQAHKDFLAQVDPAANGKFAGPVNGQADAGIARPRPIVARREIRRTGRAAGCAGRHQLGDARIDRAVCGPAPALDDAVGHAHDGGLHIVIRIGGGDVAVCARRRHPGVCRQRAGVGAGAYGSTGNPGGQGSHRHLGQ